MTARIRALRAALIDIAQYGTDPDGHPDPTIRAQEALRADTAAMPDYAVPPVYGYVQPVGPFLDRVVLSTRAGTELPIAVLPRGVAGWVADHLGHHVAHLAVALGLADDMRSIAPSPEVVDAIRRAVMAGHPSTGESSIAPRWDLQFDGYRRDPHATPDLGAPRVSVSPPGHRAPCTSPTHDHTPRDRVTPHLILIDDPVDPAVEARVLSSLADPVEERVRASLADLGDVAPAGDPSFDCEGCGAHPGQGHTLMCPTRDTRRPADPLAPVPGDLWQACTVGVLTATRPIGRQVRLTAPGIGPVEGTLVALDPADVFVQYRVTLRTGDDGDAPYTLTLPLGHPVEVLR